MEDIKGIGKSTAEQLLKEFKSVKNIQLKSQEEIAKVIGVSKAKIVYNILIPKLRLKLHSIADTRNKFNTNTKNLVYENAYRRVSAIT